MERTLLVRPRPRSWWWMVIVGFTGLALGTLPNGLAGSSVGDPTPVQTASAADRFDLAHQALHDLAHDYAGDVLKTIGSLLLVIGWLMTSNHAQAFLHKNATARNTALKVIPVLAIANTVWLWDRFAASQTLAEVLARLDYVPAEYYTDDRITGLLWTSNLVLQLTLFVTVFVLIYAHRKPAAS